MNTEMKRLETMHTVEESANYLGAMIPGEKRLVLVPVDPQEPWAAFKRMRSWMKESKTEASVDLFQTRATLDHTAKVIPLRRKTS